MGPIHHDKELNNPSHHVHVDTRFITDEDLRLIDFDPTTLVEYYKFKLGESISYGLPAVFIYGGEAVEIKEVPKRCLRGAIDLRSIKFGDNKEVKILSVHPSWHEKLED